MTALISVPIPTIAGREKLLAQAIKSYQDTANVEILVSRGAGMTCGLGWTTGADKATGDYIAFGADDVEMLPGWAEAAIALCDENKLPAAVVLNTDGTVQSCGGAWGEMEPHGAVTRYSRSPVIKREWWEFVGPIPAELHYFTDDWVTWRCRQHGIEPVVSHDYRYVHHLSSVGRVEQRMGSDGQVFQQYVDGVLP